MIKDIATTLNVMHLLEEYKLDIAEPGTIEHAHAKGRREAYSEAIELFYSSQGMPKDFTKLVDEEMLKMIKAHADEAVELVKNG